MNLMTAEPGVLCGIYKARGIKRCQAWSRFVIDRALRPEMDAKAFYAIFEHSTPIVLREAVAPVIRPTHDDMFLGCPVEVGATNCGHRILWLNGMTGHEPGHLPIRFKSRANLTGGK